MKERAIVATVVSVLAGALILGTRNTDVIFIAVSIVFFILCIAYAEGCEKL
jgi:1,4-dihydroxy-2-naphthoate octaprenyltransferase